MRSEVYGSWKMLIGKKFTAFVRAYRTEVEVRKILDEAIRQINYKTPIFLRETRDGNFYMDYLADGTVMRYTFTTTKDGIKFLSQGSLHVHPEVNGYVTEEDFFIQASISEDIYRNYFITKYFRRPLKNEPINMFAARIQDDNIEGLIMHHSYTYPFIEYVLKKDRYIIVTDKPIDQVKIPNVDLPENFELHIIDEDLDRKQHIFARVGNVEIMYPEDVKSLDERIKVPTISYGMLRLIPVPAREPEKILEKILKIVENPQKIYIRKEKTTIITPDEKITVYHSNPPWMKRE